MLVPMLVMAAGLAVAVAVARRITASVQLIAASVAPVAVVKVVLIVRLLPDRQGKLTLEVAVVAVVALILLEAPVMVEMVALVLLSSCMEMLSFQLQLRRQALEKSIILLAEPRQRLPFH